MKSEIEDVQIDLNEASRLTGYTPGHIRNLVYAGAIKRMSQQSQKKNEEGKLKGRLKRGPKIRLSKNEVLEKLGKKSA